MASGRRRKESRRVRRQRAGRLNALRHGFYSRGFSGEERRALAAPGCALDLRQEVVLLKVLLRRVFEMASDQAHLPLGGWMRVLAVSGLAMARMATVLQVQALLEKGGDPRRAAPVAQSAWWEQPETWDG